MKRRSLPVWLAAAALLCASSGNGLAADAVAEEVNPTTVPPPRIQIIEIVAPPARPVPAPLLEKQKEREATRKQVAAERAAQQQAARKKFEDAARAQNAPSTPIDPSKAFEFWIERADRCLEDEDFQGALRAMDRAFNAKSNGVPWSERARSVELRVKEMTAPVEIRLKSDGETLVSIGYLLPPQRLFSARVKLMPGDYEVKGSRRDRAEVVIKLRVRNGEPPPGVVSVICK